MSQQLQRKTEPLISVIDNLNRSVSVLTKSMSGMGNAFDLTNRQGQKVMGMAHKQHGVMLGMVYDLSLLSGAFEKFRKGIGTIMTGGFLERFWGTVFRTGKTTQKEIKKGVSPIMFGGEPGKTPPFKLEEKGKSLIEALAGTPSDLMTEAQKYGNLGKYLLESFRDYSMEKLRGILGEAVPPNVRPMREAVDSLTESMKVIRTVDRPFGEAVPVLREQGSFMKLMGKARKVPGMFNKQFFKPLMSTAGAGIMMGFQVQAVMMLMQAFAQLFSIFQPVTDVLSILVETVGTGFMPLVTALLEAFTSPESLAFMWQMQEALLMISTAMAPLIPIGIQLINIALLPLTAAFTMLGALIVPFTPHIQTFANLLTRTIAPLMLLNPLIKSLADLTVIAISTFTTFEPAIIGVSNASKALLDGMDAAGKAFWRFLQALTEAINSILIDPINVSISAINQIPGVHLNKLERLQTGGNIISGGLAILHAGETVVPAEVDREPTGGIGAGMTINITINGVAPGADMDELAYLIGRKLQLYVS